MSYDQPKKEPGLFMTGVILMIVTTIAALLLTFTYIKVQPNIEKNQRLEVNSALLDVLPGADDFQDKGTYFEAYKNGKLIGKVAVVEGRGYSSVIRTMVGVDTSGKITGIKVLSQAETPGLGTRIQEINPGDKEPWFQVQFKGKSLSQLKLKEEGGSIDGITGATISSRAVVEAVKTIFGDSVPAQEVPTPPVDGTTTASPQYPANNTIVNNTYPADGVTTASPQYPSAVPNTTVDGVATASPNYPPATNPVATTPQVDGTTSASTRTNNDDYEEEDEEDD